MLGVGALAVWALPKGARLTLAGVVLALVVVCGFFVKRGRATWYAIGAFAIFWTLWLGIANSDGSLLRGTLGYCGSVLNPRYDVLDDAPPGLAQQCRAVERERIPFMTVLTGVGVYALATSSRPKPLPPRPTGSAGPS